MTNIEHSSIKGAVSDQHIAIIGGGNMGTAIIGGLIAAGTSKHHLLAVEPLDYRRERLIDEHGIGCISKADQSLAECNVVLWAVKPQSFAEASSEAAPFFVDPLHISVMAGVRCKSISSRTKAKRMVRSMPNTPALIGKGIAALFANPFATEADKHFAEYLFSTVGQWVWVDQESHLDPVTALSGSGPAYVFFFAEAMVKAGIEMGLTEAQAKHLALATFSGAAELAQQSEESLEVLRERVTSKGGTTAAALSVLHDHKVSHAFEQALHAASNRAFELGNDLEKE